MGNSEAQPLAATGEDFAAFHFGPSSVNVFLNLISIRCHQSPFRKDKFNVYALLKTEGRANRVTA